MNPQLQIALQQVIQVFRRENFDEAKSILQGVLQNDINSADTIFELAISYAKANRFTEALTVFCCLQAYKSDDARIPYNLGLIYSLNGQHQLALAAYDLALKIKPDDVDTLVNKGSTCNDIKNYGLALEALENAIQLRSDIPEAWSNKGIALNNLNLYPESIDAYNEAIKLAPSYHEAWSNKSAPLNKLKRFLEASDACDKALGLKPDYPEAWSNKGVTLNELKRYDEAIAHYDKALGLKPDYPEAWSNKGVTLNELKRYDEAIAHYDKALGLKPDYPEAWSNKGVTLNELKRYDEAIAHYDKALGLKPDYPEAWSNKGVTLNELKRYDEAIAHYDKALGLKPDYPEAWSNKGVTLNELKRYDEAIAHYDKALGLKPDYPEAWSNKGVTLNELKRYDEAIAHYDKALGLKPDYPEAWSNKGVTLNELKRYDEAIAHYDKALGLKPDYPEAWSNKGVTLNELKRYDEAIAHYDKALGLKPDYPEAWSNKGVTLNELKRYDEAIAHYDKALGLKPDIDWAFGDLLHSKMRICSWSGLTESLDYISKKVVANDKVANPFALLAMNDDAFLHKKASEIYIQSKFSSNSALSPLPKLSKKEKIRIAYFSPDFRNHPLSFLTAELFEIHDRDRFEVFAFSLHRAPNGDETNLRLRKGFDRFIDVYDMSDQEIAQLARELEIDIAIDLAGLTQYSRTGIFSYRAAPIQVNWLGYPGTIGANYIDYIVADNTIIPDQSRDFYCEKVVALPDSYMVDDSKRLASSRKFSREECGLPENSFVFCCFNNDYKFNPQVLDGWSRILLAAKNSVIWISENNNFFRANITSEFESRGIDSSRIIFAPRLELMEDHLARYALADLFLDTYPYNAHTTAIDSLKTGVPIITLLGQSFASRVAASLLNAIGLSELITNSQEAYEALAIELAMDPEKITFFKLQLANNRLTTPLFDTHLFAKNLETAYIKMIERHLAGLRPDHISIV